MRSSADKLLWKLVVDDYEVPSTANRASCKSTEHAVKGVSQRVHVSNLGVFYCASPRGAACWYADMLMWSLAAGAKEIQGAPKGKYLHWPLRPFVSSFKGPCRSS